MQEAESPLGIPLKSLDMYTGKPSSRATRAFRAYAIVDAGTWRRQDIGLIYRDNCVRVEVLYRHDNTQNGTLGPSTSVVLRLMPRHLRQHRLHSLTRWARRRVPPAGEQFRSSRFFR